MAPNGYDHPEDVNNQISSFKEIMTLALQAVPGLTFGCGTDTGESTLLQIMPDLASALQNCPDVPEKAKLFVEKFCKVAGELEMSNDVVVGMDEKFDVEDILNIFAKLEISLDELVQASQGNSALEAVAKKVSEEALQVITLMKKALAQEGTMRAATASLDELYSAEEKPPKKTRGRKPRKTATK